MTTPDPTVIYSSRAASYAAGRPGYPRETLARLAQCLRPDADVADLGAGTGIMTAMLLDLGYRVIAIEPNPEMRGFAEHDLGAHARFTSVATTAEATGLADGSVDAVTVAQALHWFDRSRTRAEILRILRPGGCVVFVWNDLDRTHPVGRELDARLRRLLSAYAAQRARPDLVPNVLAGEALPAATPVVEDRFEHHQVLDAKRFRSRFTSASYAPHGDALGMKHLASELAAVFTAHARDGIIEVPYTTTAIFARP